MGNGRNVQAQRLADFEAQPRGSARSARRTITGSLYMDQRWRGHNTTVLWGLILLAMAYGGLLHYLHTLTGINILDGSMGVLLGLYICSHPAANAVDLLFFKRGALHQLSSEWSGVSWLALNVLVLLVGWIVIVIGATRLVGGAAGAHA